MTTQPDTTPTPAIQTGRFYPGMPPSLPGETPAQYTDRLTGADRTGRRPYDHPRNRQCSIGYHDECSDPDGERCKCPCHTTPPGTPRHDDPRPFLLVRDEDVTGVSGTGVVAQGVEFDDGVVALRWLGEWPTSVVFHDEGVRSVQTVYGHGGKTRVVWIDPEVVAPAETPEAPAVAELAKMKLLAESLTAYAAEIHKRGHRDGCDYLLLDQPCSCDYLPACRILLAFPARPASPAGGEHR